MTNEQLATLVETLRAEVGRCQSMIQELGESVDLSRREVVHARKRCEELHGLLELATARAERSIEIGSAALTKAEAIAHQMEDR